MKSRKIQKLNKKNRGCHRIGEKGAEKALKTPEKGDRPGFFQTTKESENDEKRMPTDLFFRSEMRGGQGRSAVEAE